jgi:hypothetical protein
MSHNILMQYVGFESKDRGREYRFEVRCSAEDLREFTLTIPDEAFNSRRVRYQDAPDVCSLKLRQELTTNANVPSQTHFQITDEDLDDYRLAHTSKTVKKPWTPKPREDY